MLRYANAVHFYIGGLFEFN